MGISDKDGSSAVELYIKQVQETSGIRAADCEQEAIGFENGDVEAVGLKSAVTKHPGGSEVGQHDGIRR